MEKNRATGSEEETRSAEGTELGAERGAELGAELGTELGTEPGAELGTEPGAAVSLEATEEDRDLDAFWTEARTRARFDWIGTYGGPTVLGSLRPPAWSFGSSPQEADEFLTRLLDGGAPVSTTAPRGDYDAEGATLPERGGVSIVLDGAGHPRALVATTAVSLDGDVVTEELSLLYPTKRHR